MSPERSGSPASACTAPTEPQRAETLGIALQLINIMRDVREDWELGRVYLPQDELAVARRDGGRHRSGQRHAGLAVADGLPGRTRAYLPGGRPGPARARSTAAAPPASARSPASTARRSSGSRRAAIDVFDGKPQLSAADEAPDRRRVVLLRVAVVGGGLAGLSAALELVDRGHEVMLHEARPTLGGAVQTLPEREGDPPPPPDNGQHIALGCFTDYQRFLARIGKAGALRREPLRLPVIDEHGDAATIGPGLRLLGYGHVPLSSRFAIARAALRLRSLIPAEHGDETFAALLRRFGHGQTEIDRFWDVFVRPALNLPSEEAGADYGIFTVQTALFGGRGASDLLLPTEPLGEMHGDAAGRALGAAGGDVRLESRVESLDELDADAVIVGASPTPRRRRLLGNGSSGPRAVADRQRPPALRPAAAPPPAGRAARLAGALGLRPWRAHRPRAARRRPVPDRRLERGSRAAGDPRQEPGRHHGRRAARTARRR